MEQKTDIFLIYKQSVLPTKKHESDTGFDVTVISRLHSNKDELFKVTMYETGICLRPPKGYYYELVPRSSLQKFGYMLANSVGIIDNEYRGEIMVPLIKFDKDAPDLELPMRVAQLIPRKIENINFNVVDSFDHESERGTNGFGSTGY